MRIEVSVPGLLADSVGGRAKFAIEAEGTVREAIAKLFAEYPMLKHHVYTEKGEVRKHVMICYNRSNIDWLESLDIPLKPGDKLMVMQLVSGG